MVSALSGRLGGADASDPATIRNFLMVFNAFVPSTLPSLSPTPTPSVTHSNNSAAPGILESLLTRKSFLSPVSAGKSTLVPALKPTSPFSNQHRSVLLHEDWKRRGLVESSSLNTSIGSADVTLDIIGSLSMLGYQTADAFQAALDADINEAISDGSFLQSTELSCACNVTLATVQLLAKREFPTLFPTPLPSPVPSLVPSPVPTLIPSPAPTPLPSSLPSSVPTSLPSGTPSSIPSSSPSPVPTLSPSPLPTFTPTSSPTRTRCPPGQFENALSFDCDFGADFCSFENAGTRDWKLVYAGGDHGPSEDPISSDSAFAYASTNNIGNISHTYILEASLGGSVGRVFYSYFIGNLCDSNSSSLVLDSFQDGAWIHLWSASPKTDFVGVWIASSRIEVDNTMTKIRFTGTLVGTRCTMALDDIYIPTDCNNCSLGKYQNNIGSSECLDCRAGSYCGSTGLTDVTGPCNAGRYSLAGATTCSSCPNGQYQSAIGSINCTLCPGGRTSDETGSISSSACSSCSAGRYSDNGAASCIQCSPGTFSDTVESRSCTDCEEGKYTSKFGSTSCTFCLAGHYSESTGASECTLCEGGYYQPSAGQIDCIKCVSGKFSTDERTDCIQCGSGTFVRDNIECENCPAGQYAPTAAFDKCSVRV